MNFETIHREHDRDRAFRVAGRAQLNLTRRSGSGEETRAEGVIEGGEARCLSPKICRSHFSVAVYQIVTGILSEYSVE